MSSVLWYNLCLPFHHCISPHVETCLNLLFDMFCFFMFLFLPVSSLFLSGIHCVSLHENIFRKEWDSLLCLGIRNLLSQDHKMFYSSACVYTNMCVYFKLMLLRDCWLGSRPLPKCIQSKGLNWVWWIDDANMPSESMPQKWCMTRSISWGKNTRTLVLTYISTLKQNS